MRRIVTVLISFVLALGIAGLTGEAQAKSGPPPQSMAAIGDSMTQAYDACCSYGNHPANSWSTGYASSDGITSHYEHLLTINPDIAGRNYNDAVSGARMANAPGQATQAVSQKAKYVTILMGANDVCTSSPDTMTSVETFRAQYRQTLQTLNSGLSRSSRIFVASIPDIYQLWQLFHTNPIATTVWDIANICQSMLAPERTEEQRQLVRAHNIALNQVLQEECAAYTRCKFDGNAVFNYQFGTSAVSALDYFHPSLVGQAELANITWVQSWWN